MYEKRAYQDRAIEEARRVMRNGVKRFIFQSPTGSGKTLLAGLLILKMLERGKKIVFAAHRRELVLQPRVKFIDYVGIPESQIGIVKSGMAKLRVPGAPIQIVSIQSVYGKTLPPADVVMIDECHLARAKSYEWLVAQYPNAYLIGLTATPTRLDGRSLGDIFQHIIEVAQPSELFRDGYISRPAMYTVPESQLPDLSGIRHMNGDFHEGELNERVMRVVVMGSIVEHWAKRAKGLRTMLFAVTKKHAAAMSDLLNGAGIRARFVSGDSSEDERKTALADLEAGTIDVLCQVGLWIEGLDMPPLKCAIMARPTESEVIHRQTTGRIMRPWNNVQPVLLDHAGNCRRLGIPTTDKHYDLHEEKTKRTATSDRARTCPVCGAIVELTVKVCACGAELGRKKEVEHNNDVDLVEIVDDDSSNPRSPSMVEQKATYTTLWEKAYKDGFDTAWVMRRFAEKYGTGHPHDWTPPPRPKVEYSLEEKIKQVKSWTFAQYRNNLDDEWLKAKYEAKYQEPLATFRERHAEYLKEKPAEPASVQLELPAAVEADEKVGFDF